VRPNVLQSRGGRRALFAVAVLAQLVALYWPRPVDPGRGLPWDKAVHMAIFGAVMWTGLRAGVRPLSLAAALAVHAGVSEVVQATLLDRDGNVPDAVADVTGVALGWAAGHWWPAAGRTPTPGLGTPADDGAPDRR
jgi:hypothetical protein